MCSELETQQSLPVTAEILEEVLNALPVIDIGRLQQVSGPFVAAACECRQRVLQRRGLAGGWPWRKAHAAESALFSDALGGLGHWAPGPNRVDGNVMERGSDDDWLWLSGGIDWQGFQGGFQCISPSGIQPSWITFRVRVATPALSGAFLTFSAARRTWGLEDVVLAFQYSGDERSQQRRCFVVQTGATQHGDTSFACRVESEIVADRPYEVAVHFEWESSLMSVFIDGTRCVERVPFRADRSVRYAAVYNWRSGARTAFSELMLGNSCPFDGCAAVVRRAKSRPSGHACCRRRTTAPLVKSGLAKAGAPKKWLFAGAVFGFLMAAATQQILAGSV